jgi:ABC-type branched-subunit amino acid transport system substrate-binding protein
MPISRRVLVRSLGIGALGAAATSACTRGDGGARDPSSPTQGSRAGSEPARALRIGVVTTARGPVARRRAPVLAAVTEGVREINYDGGVFGRDVELLEPRVVESDDEDLGAIARGLAEAGASAVLLAVDDALLIEHLDAIAATGMAIVSPTSSSMRVRAEGRDSGLLIRLAPSNRALGAVLVEQAVHEDHGERGGAPGTIAVVGPDDEASMDLLEQIRTQGRPQGAEIVLEDTYDAADPGDVGHRARAIAAAGPALLVLTGGQETGALLGALHDELADEHGHPRLEMTVRLTGDGALDHSEDGLPEGALDRARALQGGGTISEDFRLLMITRDDSLLEPGPSGLDAATQSFDGIALICLAAQQALTLEGTALAGAIPHVLTGDDECADMEECTNILRDGLSSGEPGSIALTPASGDLALGQDGDLVSGRLRVFAFDRDGSLAAPEQTGFDLSS